MKFSDFKTKAAAEADRRKFTSINALPSGNFAGRRILREDTDSDEDIEWLKRLICIECGEDLFEKHTETAPNVSHYQCLSKPTHKFMLVRRVSPLRMLMDAVGSHMRGQVPITAADLIKMDQEHMAGIKD